MGFASQLGLLLWKNWLLQKRRICVTVFEVIIPVFFALLLLAIRALVEPDNVTTPTNYPLESTTVFYPDYSNTTQTVVLGYAPSNTETTKVMNHVEQMFQNYTINQQQVNANFSLRAFATEQDGLDYFSLNSNTMRHMIVFYDVDNTSTNLPQHTRFAIRPYTGDIRWRTKNTFPFFQTNSPRDSGKPPYKNSEVIYFQRLMGEALTRYWREQSGQSNDQIQMTANMQRLSYPEYIEDPLITVVQTQLPLFLVLSFVLSVIINTKNLIYEKEKKLKESMKLMGLRVSVHWMSWFLTFLLYIVPAIVLYSLLMGVDVSSNGPVLAETDLSLFFVFLLCYAVALITFCFMISSFIQKANVGAAAAGVLFFATFFAVYFIDPNYETLSKEAKMSAGLLFNTAMALGTKVVGIYEGTGEGAQWNNFHEPGTVDDNLSLLDCMIMLLVDSLIHLLITWYMDNVRPGEFGVPKPIYFCFMKSYWCGSGKASTDSSMYESNNQNSTHFEKDPVGIEAGIKIHNLRKKFAYKVAVEGTSLNMYDGQVTVLLGHNGAGKTTTMSMLTGFIPPSDGTAIVNGYDIRDNISGVRSSLGLCPQHNILFGSLTVREHLEFFARLKGSTSSKLKAEVVETAREIGLEGKIDTFSKNLSGGQKRKLSVGIALIGGSKVVILDEPTSGMDPGARRQTWNVLQKARQGRTVLLSTHYMDEADLLGDRIAIMAEGVIKCCGSSMFLKKLYGAGYHMVAVKNQNCDVNRLTDYVQSHIATAELETVINQEVSYRLPDSESAKFPALFRDLEAKREKLGITSFGTTATTMEEVFLRVGESAASDDENGSFLPSQDTKAAYVNPSFDSDTPHGTLGSKNKVDTIPDNSENKNKKTDIMSFNKGFKKNTGFALEMSRMRGLFVKKALHTWRNVTVTLVQLVLPLVFLILGLAADEARPSGADEPALTFDLGPFGSTYIPYTAGHHPSVARDTFAQLYATQFGNSHSMENVNLDNYNFSEYTLMRAADLGISTFNKKMIIGMEVINITLPNEATAIGWYNGQPYHAMPVSVNMLMNTMLQHFVNESVSLESSINPMPKDDEDSAEFTITLGLSTGFSISLFISFGMAFLTTMFIYFLIKERQVGAKHMQVVSGVSPLTYWIPTFCWDFINYIVPSLFLILVFVAYQKHAFLEDARYLLTMFVLLVYGWAVLPSMYAVQFAFKSPPTGVVMVIMLNIVTGIVTLLTVFLLRLLDEADIADTLDHIFMVLFPNYNMAMCFGNIYTNYIYIDFCKPLESMCLIAPTSSCCAGCTENCIEYDDNYMALDYPGIGKNILFMFAQGIFYMAIVMLIEFQIFQRIWYRIRGAQVTEADPMAFEMSASGQSEDSDVAAERQRINSSPASVLSNTDSLLLVNLFKRYGQFVAVDHICVGVPEQECFGLLGQNGAGKTTTFKMLTGDVMVTGGNAHLTGHNVRSDIKQVQANMGYCPQFDALIDQMTGRETLTMYARLKGVPESNVDTVVNCLLDILMLNPHADKLAGHYSGGNKRKLSTAIALVGDPPFIMLDEPSSGMDPKARRQLWNVLSQVRASGRTLVLTSHSMEECDALCTRIAIMVNGRFMCLGSPQHLKNKFGQGYTLIVQLGLTEHGATAPNEPIIEYICQHFPGAKVFDDHQGYVHFQVPDNRLSLADVFELMESTKTSHNVADYSVHQTTLEQVFLTFTRGQVIPKEEKTHSMLKQMCCCCCLACGCYK